MNPRAVVNSMLSAAGAVLKRQKKHEVWQLPNGRTFVRATTPSDIMADANNLSDLRHALGVVPEHAEGERREKRNRPGAQRQRQIHAAPQNSTLADQLRVAGVAEDALRERLRQAEAEKDAALRFATHVIMLRDQCWGCRLREWWRNKRWGS